MPLRITVEAKPGRKLTSIAVRSGTIIVSVRERAIDGRANAAIERAIAAWLGVNVAAVSIVRGAAGRHKAVEVSGIGPEALASAIAACEQS